MLLIYADEAMDVDVTPDHIQEMMAAYGAYIQNLAQAGVLIATEGLQSTATATTVKVRGGQTLTTHGPFAETAEQLGGFVLIECGNLDEAISWAAQCPTAPMGSVEVRPVMDYGQ
ncbi:MAG: YciI family protein [Chloroflexota bacterium]